MQTTFITGRDATVSPALHDSPARPGERPSAMGRRHILVVEAHEDTRELYVQWFRWAGFRLSACATAPEAIGAVAEEPPDLVITSIRLPGMDGFALCELLKGAPATNNIPVIALVTGSPDHDRAVAERQFAAVLMLPCFPASLLTVVRRLVSNGHRTTHAAA